MKIFLTKEVEDANSKKIIIAKKIDLDSSLILSILSYKIIEKPFRNNNFIDVKNFIKLIFFQPN